MPVLGDVSLFASSAYVAQLLEEEGCRCVRVPGVPSFCAAAARLGRSLTEMDLPVHIVPAGGFPLEEALDLPGTKVLMKSRTGPAPGAGGAGEPGPAGEARPWCRTAACRGSRRQRA